MKNINNFNEQTSYWNGFFDVDVIKDGKTLKQLYRDALSLSYDHHVDELTSIQRKRTDKFTAEEFIEQKLSLNTHNVVIDRFTQGGYKESWKYGEIGCRLMDTVDYFLFIYVSYGDLYDLVEKYNLPKMLR
jgi:hypothetical protein